MFLWFDEFCCLSLYFADCLFDFGCFIAKLLIAGFLGFVIDCCFLIELGSVTGCFVCCLFCLVGFRWFCVYLMFVAFYFWGWIMMVCLLFIWVLLLGFVISLA